MSAFKNAVIARAGILLWCMLRPNGPKQSPAVEHDVNKPQWFVRFTASLGGLLRVDRVFHILKQYADPRNDGQGSFRNDGVIWRLFVIFIACYISSVNTNAQTAYTGGAGDGHAMGELVLRQVGVGELGHENGYAIYPSLAKPNEAIYISTPLAGGFVLVDLTGRTILSQNITQPVLQLPITVSQAGLYLGILRTEEGIFTQKIVIME